MTTAQAVGAVSNEAKEWYAIDWPTIRRLQARIAQATKEGRWGKVRALQRLLTHSYSGKILAVRRVTENNGKKTPGSACTRSCCGNHLLIKTPTGFASSGPARMRFNNASMH